MPWRLISFLVVLTLVVLFAAFNQGNVTDISFGFYTVPKVPVFLSLFAAFLLGTFVMVPFAVKKRGTKVGSQKRRDSKQNAQNAKVDEPSAEVHNIEETPTPPQLSIVTDDSSGEPQPAKKKRRTRTKK